MTSLSSSTGSLAEVSTDIPFTITRVGVIMTPDPNEPDEAEGVLNPATAWGDDGQLYLYPRLVAKGNYSRVGRALVEIVDGVPTGVQRRGIALQADRAWEHGVSHGGTEDPRITWIPSLDVYVMTYVAFGPLGPRPSLAVSENGENWERLGPVQFQYDDELDTDLNLFPNKDVVFFPEIVPDRHGRPSYAMLHRPMWDLSFVRPEEIVAPHAGSTDDRPSIWISYIAVEDAIADFGALARPYGHRVVAVPEQAWESLKIGAGPAPIRVDEGWLLIFHGVSGEMSGGAFLPQKSVRYAAGIMILDADDPSRVLARSAEPLLRPETADERSGVVANVVFPTAIEKIGDETFVFYGMADAKIGVARLDRVI